MDNKNNKNKKNIFTSVSVDIVYMRKLFENLESKLLELESTANTFGSTPFGGLSEDDRSQFILNLSTAMGYAEGISNESNIIVKALKYTAQFGPKNEEILKSQKLRSDNMIKDLEKLIKVKSPSGGFNDPFGGGSSDGGNGTLN